MDLSTLSAEDSQIYTLGLKPSHGLEMHIVMCLPNSPLKFLIDMSHTELFFSPKHVCSSGPKGVSALGKFTLD